MCDNYVFILDDDQKVEVPKDFRLIVKLPENIGNKIINESKYCVQSKVSYQNLKSFLDYLFDKTDIHSINEDNIYDFLLLCDEFSKDELKKQLEKPEYEDIYKRSIIKNVVSKDNTDKSVCEEYIARNLDFYLEHCENEMHSIQIPILYNIFNHPQRNLADQEKAYQFIKNKFDNNNESGDDKDTKLICILLNSLDGSKISEKSYKDSISKKDEHYGFAPKCDATFLESFKQCIFESQNQIFNRFENYVQNILNQQSHSFPDFKEYLEQKISNEMTAKIDDISKKISQISLENEETKKCIKNIMETVDDLKSSMDKIKQDVNENENKVSLISDKNESIEKSIQKVSNVIEDIQPNIQKISDKIESCCRQILNKNNTVQISIQDISKKINDTNINNQQLSEVKNDIQKSIQNVSNVVNEIKSNVQSTSTKINDVHGNSQQLTNIKNDIQKSIQNISSVVNEIKSNVQQITPKINDTQSNSQQLTNIKNDIQKSIQNVSNVVNEIKSNVQSTSTKINDVHGNSQQLTNIKNDIQKSIQNISSVVNEIKSNVQQITPKINDTQSNSQQLTNIKNDIQKSIQNVSNVVNEIKSNVQSNSTKINEIQRNSQQLTNIKNDIQKVSNISVDTKSNVQQLQTLIKSICDLINKTNKDINDLSVKEIEKFEKSLKTTHENLFYGYHTTQFMLTKTLYLPFTYGKSTNCGFFEFFESSVINPFESYKWNISGSCESYFNDDLQKIWKKSNNDTWQSKDVKNAHITIYFGCGSFNFNAIMITNPSYGSDVGQLSVDGSDDGRKWTNDIVIFDNRDCFEKANYTYHLWCYNDANDNYYKYIRFRVSKPNAKGKSKLCIKRIELFGSFKL